MIFGKIDYFTPLSSVPQFDHPRARYNNILELDPPKFAGFTWFPVTTRKVGEITENGKLQLKDNTASEYRPPDYRVPPNSEYRVPPNTVPTSFPRFIQIL